jgi:hypothetical protein
MRPPRSAGEQAIDDQRREGAVLIRRVDQPHEPQRRVEDVGVEGPDIDRPHAAVAVRVREAGLDHHRRDHQGVEHQPETQVGPLRRRFHNFADQGQPHRADQAMRGVVPEGVFAEQDVLAALCNHTERRLDHAVNRHAGRRDAIERQARLWLNLAIERQSLRNTLGELLQVSPHA